MEINKLKGKILAEIESVEDIKDLESARVKYLGRKGELTQILRSLKDLPINQRRKIGPQAQQLKKELENLFVVKTEELKIKTYNLKSFIDITKPGEKIKLGHFHVISKVEEEIRQIFLSMNFSAVEGPEIEDEYHNFDALNIPPEHPARDMWDTFWIKNPKLLLRTHTSPVQIRYMETHQPPFQIIAPGRVFRYEATDASHETTFEQLEGLMVGKDVSLANFKFVIEEFFKKFFRGQKIEFRFVPSYYPFVEPGLDIAIKLKGGKWMEVAGAGMVHRKVFEAVGYNPYEWQGFAFGFGVTRLAMIKYNIPDIRLFNSGDLRFIKQF